MKDIGKKHVWSHGLIACSLLFTFHALAVDRTWTNGAQNGLWNNADNWSPAGIPANADIAIFDAVGGAVSIADNRTIQQIRVNGTTDVALNIADNVTFTVSNAGAQGIQAYTANLAINGPGLLALSTSGSSATDVNHLDNGVNFGYTLAINAKIIPVNTTTGTGFETWSASNKGGTVILNDPANTLSMNFNAGAGHTVVVPVLSDIGQPSSIGTGAAFLPSRSTILRYTGPAVSTSRQFLLNGGDATFGFGGGIEQAGTGILEWTGPIQNNNNSAQTLRLLGAATSPKGWVSGPISNNQGTLGIAKDGSGTWELSGNNSFTGPIAINGGTLRLDSTSAAGKASQMTMADGTILDINPSNSDTFTLTLPHILANGNSITINLGTAPTASTVTFGGLTAASVAISAPNAGTAANRIFITGLATGVVGPWLTLNNAPAHYSTTAGLTPQALGTATLATKGNSLPNDDAIKATITTVGTGVDINLPADPTALYSLTQAAAGPAVVNNAGQTLLATEVAITATASALTIGATPQDGKLLPPLQLGAGGTEPIIPDNSGVDALNPLIWYDPSDETSVTVSAGLVTGITNKGSSGATHNAVVRGGWMGPVYATGIESHAALPMLESANSSQGLQSSSNTGITGTAPRTIVAVMSRMTGKECIVSIGEAANNRVFEPYLRNDFTRFGTYGTGNDIDTTVSPPETPIVMTFISSENNGTVTFEGFANGVSAGMKQNTTFSTANTPLFLMARNGGTTVDYRGQIGEVLFFDKALNLAERELVEGYLAAKWQQPKASIAESSTLTLRNDSTSETLTVNAVVKGPDSAIVGLIKSGAGPVTLAGGATLRGPVVIEDGTLTLNTPADLTDTLADITSGAGKLAKNGTGILALPAAAANTHSGGTDIFGGTVQVGNSRALGTGPVIIADGATLDIGGTFVNESVSITNSITVSGMGVGNAGAIVNNGTATQRNAFQNTVITLADDTAFGGTSLQRWDLAGLALTLDLNGNTLIKTGVSDFRISPATVINAAPNATAFDIRQGSLGIESNTILAPNDNDRDILISSDARLGLYNVSTPINWAVKPADGAAIWAYGNNETTNINVLTSDILLSGTLHLTAAGAFGKNLTGQLTGTGGLSIHDGGLRAVSLLSNPNNTFTGPVAVSNAVLGLLSRSSLPSLSQLSLAANGSAVRTFMGDANGWTGAQVKDLAESGHFNAAAAGNKRLQIHVGEGDSANIPAIGSAFIGDIEKFGAGTLALDGNITLANGNARVYTGGLILTNNAIFNADRGSLYLGEALLTDGTRGHSLGNIIGGDATYIGTDLGYNVVGAPTIFVAPGASNTVLDVTGNAQVQAVLVVGGQTGGNTAAAGAVYQSGNSRWYSIGGAANDNRIGRFGYGYYQLDGGDLIFKGWSHLGGINNASSVGILRQTGGRFTYTGLRDNIAQTGTTGESYAGFLGLSRGGVGILHLEGGNFLHYGNLNILDYNDGGSGTGTPGTGIMTVTGNADVTIDRQIDIGNRQGGTAVLNLNGGTLTATYIQRLDRESASFVNFNGGTLNVTNNGGNASLFARVNNRPLPVKVYDGGATVNLGDGVTRTIDIPLERPAGTGIAGIPVTSGGSGYIAPPYVAITGGGGTGATAFAHIDRETGAITSIDITCPGTGYTSIPTVTLTGGGSTNAVLATATLAPTTGTGGLTKTGLGILILNAANTYTGPTRVDGGTLILKHPQALCPQSEIIIGDGTLDLGGNTITNISVTLTGTGSIVNGKIVTASAVKTGTGTAVWDAGIEFASVPVGLVGGLWEGHLKGAANAYWNTTSPNPMNSVQLTTRAGNGTLAHSDTYAGGLWKGSYNTYVYTGYIWNRTGATQTWSWRFTFDDNVALWLDGELVRDHALGHGVVTLDREITDGPHAIEIRYGDNTGNVGPAGGLGGLTYDPLGRNSSNASDYILLADDGTGILLSTTTNDVAVPETGTIRIEEGTLLLPVTEPGLWESGPISGNLNTTAANTHDSIELTTTAANGWCAEGGTINGKHWPNESTYIYTGYIWNRAPTNETWTFVEHFDDKVLLVIDGITVLNDSASGGLTKNNVTLAPGAHTFEVRFSQGGGYVGPNTGNWFNNNNADRYSGFAVDYLGRNEEIFGNYEIVTADNGQRLTLTPFGAGADVLTGVTVNVASNATLDLGGVPREGITVTGSGTVTNGTMGTGFILSPEGDDYTGAMSVEGIGSLAGMTYRVTIRENPIPAQTTFTPGLWEGMLSEMWNTEDPNPMTGIALTTTAGNFPIGSNTSDPRKPYWDNGQRTWVYTGYIWNRTDADVTWTWRLTFDDYIKLSIDDKVIADVPLSRGVVYANYTLTPGAHPIEVRFGENGGNVGPVVGIPAGLTYDPEGRGPTSAAANFIILEDSGQGELLTLECPIRHDNGPCDVITATDGRVLDLTGLTIVPSDTESATPFGSKHIIATSTGGFTGTPTVVGFGGKTWKTLRQGNELWLTTQGGTLMILK